LDYNAAMVCADTRHDGANPDWFDRIPKVELHLHLEGAIPPPILFDIVEQHGGDPAVPDLAALDARFEYRDFDGFIDAWTWKNGYLRDYDDFTLAAEAVARDLERQNIRYAEVFFSPTDFACHGLEPQQLAAAIRSGLDRCPGIQVALVADLVRDHGPERAQRTLDQICEVLDEGVIGIGIGGSEQHFPPGPFAAVYERARGRGLRTSAHAGEAAGAVSIWGAIRELRVDRIGHGTRAIEDPQLVDHLAASGTPLEMCPLSNLCTGVVASIADHPIRKLRDRGVRVTVNTDDPKMFNTSLAGELRLLHRELGFDRHEIRDLILEAARSSWLDPERQASLTAQLQLDPAWDEPDQAQ
jgi:adenosine deaminase